ncbi:hypothetical protein ABPG75_004232 [Micractinium tetrahymenae]
MGRDGEALTQADYSLFVRFLHMASPYVAGHRGRTFVVVIPGEVVANKQRLYNLLEDILLLHGLGVKTVIVCGAAKQIDAYLHARGREPLIVGAYRVTDEVAMQGAIEAAGTVATFVSAFLSKLRLLTAPSIPVVRRHARSEGGQFHFAPAVQVVNGNYVTAKRRGIVNGIDFGSMGQVRFVQRGAIEQQLSAGNLVLLTNIGVSSSGELLNCNCFDVATHAAVELRADKLLLLTGQDVRDLELPHYLPLDDAEAMITATVCGGDEACIMESLELLGHADAASKASSFLSSGNGNGSGRAHANGSSTGSSSGDERGGMSGTESDSDSGSSRAWADEQQQQLGVGWQQQGGGSGGGVAVAAAPPRAAGQRPSGGNGSSAAAELTLDLDSWQQIGFPNAVLAAVVACKNGVKRAHLIDSDSDGALLLEMYTRDGTPGVCMIAADLYEGIRAAEGRDAGGLQQLLGMLAAEGFSLPFPLEDVPQRLQDITVIEREGKILGAAAITDLGAADDGVRVAELGVFVVHPAYRRAGFGDSLLDYVEQELRLKGFRRVAIVAGEGSYEWFAQRDFARVGAAARSILLPGWRSEELGAAAAAAPQLAPAQLYVKPIVDLDSSVDAQPGKRIGF